MAEEEWSEILVRERISPVLRTTADDFLMKIFDLRRFDHSRKGKEQKRHAAGGKKGNLDGADEAGGF